jgi:hypothetical protein
MPGLDEHHLRLPTFAITLSSFFVTLQSFKVTIALLVVINGNTSVAARDARVAAAKLNQALHNGTVYPCRPRNDGGGVFVKPNLRQHRRAGRPQIANMDVMGTQSLDNMSDVIGIDSSASQCL